jgi:hypothetical protein
MMISIRQVQPVLNDPSVPAFRKQNGVSLQTVGGIIMFAAETEDDVRNYLAELQAL